MNSVVTLGIGVVDSSDAGGAEPTGAGAVGICEGEVNTELGVVRVVLAASAVSELSHVNTFLLILTEVYILILHHILTVFRRNGEFKPLISGKYYYRLLDKT